MYLTNPLVIGTENVANLLLFPKNTAVNNFVNIAFRPHVRLSVGSIPNIGWIDRSKGLDIWNISR